MRAWRWLVAMGLCAVAAAGVSACGGSEASSSAGSAASGKKSGGGDGKAGAKSGYPQALQSACKELRSRFPSVSDTTLSIGLNAGTPGLAQVKPGSPLGYVGADPDIASAIGYCLNDELKISNFGFNGVVPALAAGHVELAVASQYDTPAREKQVSYVDYLGVKEYGMVMKGNPKNIHTLDDVCGLTAAEPAGSVEVIILKHQNDKCKAAGKDPINILQFPTIDQAAQAMIAGRAVFHLDGGTAIPSLIKGFPGKFEETLAPVQGPPEGIQLQKGKDDLINAVQGVVKAMQEAGVQKAIFKRWGLTEKYLIIPAVINLCKTAGAKTVAGQTVPCPSE